MKKLLIIAVLGLLVSNFAQPQVKMRFRLSNPYLESGYWTIALLDSVYASQTWRVGSSNMRIGFVTFPPNAATIHPDNPLPIANTNISGPTSCGTNANYSCMTTTSITGGTVISVNIARLGTCYRFNPGVYVIGRLRFNRVDTTGCIRLTINANSVVQDSITQWVNATDWTTVVDTTCWRMDYLTGIGLAGNEIPTRYELYQNFPNPFNPTTLIKYDIPKTGLVTITLYDVLGKEIRKLVNENVQPGRYEITWDARNYASGSYFYKIESGDFSDIKKMILVK